MALAEKACAEDVRAVIRLTVKLHLSRRSPSAIIAKTASSPADASSKHTLAGWVALPSRR